MKHDLISLDGKSVGSVELPEAIFGVDVRDDILHRVVRWQLARKHTGNHKTKTRGEIAGSNKKPFKQKGTGRARQGSNRVSQMRGGGKAFGPVVRSHAHSLPKKIRRLGLKSALSSKCKNGKLYIIDEAKSADGKSKSLAASLKNLGCGSTLIIESNDFDPSFFKAAKNIIGIDMLLEQGANVYDILRKESLMITRSALEKLEVRLK